jgi:hypothetical protein
MLPRSARLLAGAALALAAAATLRAQPSAPPTRPDILEVNGIGSGLVPLNGNWQFHLGDDPSWASPTLDDSAWEQITVDQPWGAQTHAGYTGRAWYRRHIVFHAAPGADPDIALYMPITSDACEIYWNGQLVGGFGRLPPHAVWYYDSVWPYTVGLGKATSGVLAIRVWKAPYDAFGDPDSGGLEGPPTAGSAEAVANAKSRDDYQWLRTNQFSIGLNLLYALTAILSFLAWLRDRRQRILGWMALYAAGPLTVYLLDDVPLLVTYRWDYGLLFLAFSVAEIGLWFLLLELLGLDRHPRLRRLTVIFALISFGCAACEAILQLFNWETGPTSLFQSLDLVLTIATTVVDLYPLVLIPFAFRRRLGLSRSILAVVAMLNQILQVTPSILTEGIRFTRFHGLDAIMNFKLQIGGSEIGFQDTGNAILFVTIVYALVSYLDTSRSRQRELEAEFRSARELQQFLVPDALHAVPGFSLTSAYRPAREVGGDFFQVIPLDSGSTLIALGDVSGKGLKAAMAVSLIVGAVRALASPQSHPAQLLRELNHRLYGSLGGGFATCAILRVSDSGSCTLASAGHPPPLLNGRELQASGALPLGIAPDEIYEEIRFSLEPGDCLALYTDGLLEARNHSGELYGFSRLQSLFTTRPSAHQAANAAEQFGQDDDITVLTLTRDRTSTNSPADSVAAGNSA